MLFTKTNSTGIKDINKKPETLNLLEENTSNSLRDNTLHDKGAGMEYLNMAPFTQEPWPRADEKDIRKLKRFFAARVTVNSVERERTERESTFASCTED